MSGTNKVSIVKVSEFEPHKITMKKDLDNNMRVKILYDKKPFLLRTDILECLHGISHINGTTYGTIELSVNEGSNTYNVLTALDQVAKVIGSKRSAELFGCSFEHDLEPTEVPYWSILPEGKGLKLLVPYSNGMPSIPFFSRDGKKIDSPVEINNKFSGTCLLRFNGVEVDNGNLKWDRSVVQIKIEESSRLPPGCLITDDEELVIKTLNQRRTTKTYKHTAMEPQIYEVENELLD